MLQVAAAVFEKRKKSKKGSHGAFSLFSVCEGGILEVIAEALVLWIITITGSRNSSKGRANPSPEERRPEQLPLF